jgi:endonuclease/exonuclease/phosphatase family metal-dependent hydrolase
MTEPNRIVTWNCKVGRDPQTVATKVRELIDDTNADVVCLNEAGGYIGALHNKFDENWYVYAKDGWEESRMNPVLVKRSLGKRQGYGDGWGTLRTTTQWNGPQGGSHEGRTWTWAVVGDLIAMSFQRCTDGDGKNSKAFVEEHDKVVKFSDNHQKFDLLVIGDHNCGPQKDFKGSSKRIAEHIGGKVRAEGGIEYAITRGTGGSVKDTGKTYGSDHPAVLWTR